MPRRSGLTTSSDIGSITGLVDIAVPRRCNLLLLVAVVSGDILVATSVACGSAGETLHIDESFAEKTILFLALLSDLLKNVVILTLDRRKVKGR